MTMAMSYSLNYMHLTKKKKPALYAAAVNVMH